MNYEQNHFDRSGYPEGRCVDTKDIKKIQADAVREAANAYEAACVGTIAERGSIGAGAWLRNHADYIEKST